MSVITKQKEKKQNRTVLLFSGGQDSVMFNKLLDPDILLYVPSGSKYTEQENKRLQNLIDKNIIDGSKVRRLDGVLNLSRFERDDFIVPNRNAYLILLASHFGETIYLGSVYGDRSFDKDKKFYELMENLLNHIWQEQHWTEQREFRIYSPFKDTTKSELVKRYIDEGNDINDILESYSCYEGSDKPCGVCKPCVRKYISLAHNNVLVPDDYYQNDPLSAKWIYEVLPDMYSNQYRGREDSEFIDVLRAKGKI